MSMTTNDPLIGRQLGDYSIQGMLGQGGMARVYRGYDARLDRYAAVKVIEPNLVSSDEDKEYRERFLREARAIARLHHPNVVNIFQFGQNEDETLYYMAMGFIEGRDLRQIMKEHNKQGKYMSHTQVLRILRDIAGALDYSHQQGVIHRDVKPSNIMVKDDGHAVLTDFGLALNAQEGTIGNTFGSVHYIAPEQAISSAQAVPQSDLYSLGVVLFEMLTGRVPFEDVSAMSVALKHISDPPPMPSEFNPAISPAVEAVILKALDKDPENRYATGAAFVNALEDALALSISDDVDTQDLKAPPAALSSTVPQRVDASSGWTVLDDAPTMSDSNSSGPGTLPFSPVDDKNTLAARQHTGPKKRARMLIRVSMGIVVVAVVGILLASGALNSGRGDPEAAPTQAAVARMEENRTSIPVVAESTDEPSETPASSDTPQPTNTNEPTVTPTNTNVPTRISQLRTVEPTDSLQEAPTDVPALLPTPDIDAESADEPQILLRYDGRSLVLYNRSPAQRINISGLLFEGVQPNGSTMTFLADEWQSDDVTSLRARDCFQLFTIRYRTLPADEFPADICNFRQGFFSTVDSFWVASQPNMTFEVKQNDQILAVCPTAISETTDEVRCLVDLRTDD